MLLTLLFSGSLAWAYPEFIGYAYSSCITCHYSGHGGGALSDYGRALFATEIAARHIYPDKMEEEDIGSKSGFLGASPLPWWIRPGLKYRGLWMKTDPGSQATTERYINMQNDINLNFFFDKKQSYTWVNTVSYTGLEPYYGQTNTWFMREYYLRWKYSNYFWVYLGQLDKVFGLRLVDHSAVNRKVITLGQYDQSQGVVLHWTYPTWDIALNGFMGNGAQQDSQKQKGFSVSGEYQWFEKFKVGSSILSSQSDEAKWNLLAFSTRMGLSKGSAIMAELGLREKTDLVSGTEPQLGAYALTQALISLTRGYNLLTTLETSKVKLSDSAGEAMRWSFGALMFPLPRTELRVMAINGKSIAENQGTSDSWALQCQMHLSY